MLTRHATNRLARYADGDLPAAEMRAVETHLTACDRCRRELEEIRFAAGVMRQLAVVSAPPSVWTAIDSSAEADLQVRLPRRAHGHTAFARWAFACVLLLAIAASTYWWTRGSTTRSWEVATLGNGSATTRMAAGEWVETGAGSRARIVVGDIGTVDVEPGTRVQLGEVRPTEYRLALARGTIRAQINAPPRLFIVDTPASTVVDLGCAYTVTVADDGASELRMTDGWAALEWRGRASLVPAGAICRTRPGVGPGIPYFEDAPASLKRAVDAFDFADGGAASVEVILRDARVRDTLTLWHLLSRVDPAQRAQVYDRMAELVPPPPAVSRDSALALDAEALRRWREELAWKW